MCPRSGSPHPHRCVSMCVLDGKIWKLPRLGKPALQQQEPCQRLRPGYVLGALRCAKTSHIRPSLSLPNRFCNCGYCLKLPFALPPRSTSPPSPPAHLPPTQVDRAQLSSSTRIDKVLGQIEQIKATVAERDATIEEEKGLRAKAEARVEVGLAYTGLVMRASLLRPA
eukprot:365598-Chlamydomonas_euryale.AAC.7